MASYGKQKYKRYFFTTMVHDVMPYSNGTLPGSVLLALWPIKYFSMLYCLLGKGLFVQGTLSSWRWRPLRQEILGVSGFTAMFVYNNLEEFCLLGKLPTFEERILIRRNPAWTLSSLLCLSSYHMPNLAMYTWPPVGWYKERRGRYRVMHGSAKLLQKYGHT